MQTRRRPAPAGRLPLPTSMLHDIRFALRLLRKSPAFAAIAVLSLARGRPAEAGGVAGGAARAGGVIVKEVAAGIALGVGAAVALSPLVPPAPLTHTSARDPLTLAVSSLILAAVAIVATSIPAHRATRIDPLVALRAE